MKNRAKYYAIGLVAVAAAAWFYSSSSGTRVTTDGGNGADKSDLIRVDNPLPNQEIASPLIIEGSARGQWYFEASFPIRLLDSVGNEVAVVPAQAQGEWMTEEFVPFRAELNFTAPAGGEGTLVLEKDNPSGLPENTDELRIPVKFSQTVVMEKENAPATQIEPPAADLLLMNVNAFFGNSRLDPSAVCEKVFPAPRAIERTAAVARAALEELLQGPTPDETAQGFLTSINPGVKIQKLTIENGVARADFDKTLEERVGGSCRVAAIRAQITQTLKQFPSVKEAVISIDGRTEDILQP